MTNHNQSFARGLDILLLFDKNTTFLTINDIVEKLEIPRSTAYRFLQTLKEKGLLESIASGKYRPGWLIADLARNITFHKELSEVSLSFMKKLSIETQETVVLTVISGTKVTVIERVESPQQLRLSFTVGQERPLHLGAPSKVILANLEKFHQQAAFERIDESFNMQKLQKELQLIKAQGYAVTNEEVDAGARGISAPIFGKNKIVLAGLTIAGPLSRMNHVQLPKFINAVKMNAEEITKLLEIT